MISIRRRLLVGLIALVIVVDGLAVLVTYRRAQVSTSLLLDYQLQQMALSLRAQGAAEPDAPFSPQGDASEFAIQIWQKDGTPVYSSRPDVGFTHQIPDGYSDLAVGGESWRAFAVQTPRRVILVAQSAWIREHLARTIALRTSAPLLLFTPLLAVAIWLIVLRTLEPIKRVVGEVRNRDVDTLSPLGATDLPREIEPLVAEVNRLLERLHAAFQVQRNFIADAAHELRSPLTALRLQVQLFNGAQSEAERDDIRGKLIAAMDRAGNLVHQLLTLARSEPGGGAVSTTVLNLSDVVRTAIAECAAFSIARETDLALEADGEIQITGDPEALRMLVRNLVDNAIRYAPRRSKVVVRLSQADGLARLEVDDAGPGLSTEERDRVFDRFYRGRNTAESGTGLGLAIVKSIAVSHRGAVKLGQSDLGGLKVTVVLPSDRGQGL